ncbi:thioredoxin-like protein [Thelephora ganbajun]|uniref:Thioredoxin-like protein n=1 Tax=Thelephora ganbajun TaxID=370292 RepID=A0ACB6ZQY0_THEGA|nr:thioredoxin-like protein [Thelephora ganbajun]
MGITQITTNAQLDEILGQSPTKVSVIDFHATWCGPCHQIAPLFEAFSKQYSNVNFLKCDVDAAKAVSAKYKVTAMPTFIFFKGSKQVDIIRGADRAGLDKALRNLAGSPGQAAAEANFPGKGIRLGGDGPAGTPPPNVRPAGAAAAGFKGFIYSAADVYHGLDPQLKILCWVLLLYVAIQTFF